MENLLEIKNLKTSFFTHIGEVQAVRGVSFNVQKGEAIGIVGESGSGKSVTMMSLMKLLPDNGKIVGGEVLFDGKNLTTMSDKEMERIRGNDIGMIFQEPMTSLNPVFSIGNQLMEPLKKHMKLSKSEAFKASVNMLNMVGIPSPEKRMKQYPHEFSGGMRQRVMIAMAMTCNPKLLIADEPTTALDVTIQAQILDLMKNLKNKVNMSIILITHDLGIVADICSRISVMYGGVLVEQGFTRDIFYNPRHPYTIGLLNSIPKANREEKERLRPIDGQPPDLFRPPVGCPFAPRCEHAMKICETASPPLFNVGEEHHAACFLNHEFAPEFNWARG